MSKRSDTIGIERSRGETRLLLLLLLIALPFLTGCGALHPIKGVPASYLPVEYLGPSRDGLRPINPMLLTRSRPYEHLVDAGDVLSIYVPGVLGTASTDVHTIGETPPINFPSDIEMPPTIGFPITVRGDGTLSLPQIPAIPVRGMTLAQVEQAIQHAYTTPKQILPVGKERILVSLQRSRDYRVLVVREDSSFVSTSTSGVGTVNLGSTRRGTSRIVSLKAYENDVLHALSRVQGTDGLPGLDAEGAIYVIRRQPRGACGPGTPGVPFGSGPMVSDFGEVHRGLGGQSAFPVSRGQTVVRYQSPDGNYRSGSGNGYSGHSFAASQPSTQSNGRYVSPLSSIRPASQPSSATVQDGRYGHSTHNYGTSIAPATASGNQHGLSAGRYGAPLPTRTPPPVRAVNWTHVPPGMSAGSVSGQYGPALQMQSMPTGSPMTMDPSPVWQAPAVGMADYGAPLPTGQPGMPMYPGGGQMGQVFAPLSTVDYFDSIRAAGLDGSIDGPNVVRIPIRVGPGETLHISEEDITLQDGDIVFIEARASEVFYTGGLLGGGQFTLPRDYDLRALEALSIAQSQGNQGGKSVGGASALNQDVTISASKLIVVRKLADGTSLPIEVDLNRAKQDMTGRENIIIQPGDYLYLQYKGIEAVGAFFERHLLEGALFGLATSQFTSNGN